MRPHRDHRLERLTAPQACVLSTLNTLGGRIRWEEDRFRVIVKGAGFRSTFVVNARTLWSLVDRRLLQWDRNAWALSELGKAAVSSVLLRADEQRGVR